MHSTDPLVAGAFARLTDESPTVAATAADAFAVLTGDGTATLSQLGLQRFLWFQVPMMWPPAGRAVVVEALAHLLDLAGMQRYAAICRSAETTAVLRAHARRPRTGLARARKAEERSGVVPASTPHLHWSPCPGPSEADAYLAAATTLEMAIAAGDLVVGSRGWRQRHAAITDESLTRARPELQGSSHLEVILAERAESWARMGSTTRLQLLAPLIPRITRELRPTNLHGLEPVLSLLDRASTGIPVTLQGDPQPGTLDGLPAGFVPPTGSDSPDNFAGVVLAALTDMGALVNMRNALYRTAHGDRLLADPTQAFHCIVNHVWASAHFHDAVAEMVFAALLRDGPHSEAELAARLHPMLEPNWRDSELGLPTPPEQTKLAIVRFVFLAAPLGAIEVAGSWPKPHGAGLWPDRRLSLTDLGVAYALQVLHVRATAPSESWP